VVLAAIGYALLGCALARLGWQVRAVHAAVVTGWLIALLLGSGVLAHWRWYFGRRQSFLRELGGPAGWLNRHDLTDSAGVDALRRAAGASAAGSVSRIRGINPWGFEVGRLVSGSRWLRGQRVYSPWARAAGIVGPQGSGKTQFLIGIVVSAPGAALVTSTKPELVAATRRLRQRVGPTAVFNPSRLGDLGNTLFWDPVTGCQDQATADRRAWALVRGSGGADGVDRADFWARKAVEIIRCYLMAAALSGADMAAVMNWANAPGDDTPTRILSSRPEVVPEGWLGTLTTHLGAADNTRSGYFATVVSAVGFADSPTVAHACRRRDGGFDVARFIRDHGTLYLVGGADDRRLAPLLTALTEEVFHTAQRVAATCPGGRLPVPLAMCLDEVANITPVPLDRWAADSRGWGITVIPVVQSLAQFATTWGKDRAEVIWENLPTKIILPGVANEADLKTLAFLAGTRHVRRETEAQRPGQPNGWQPSSRVHDREPVVAGHTIHSMPRWHAYVLGLGRRAAVVRYEPGHAVVRRLCRHLPIEQTDQRGSTGRRSRLAGRIPAPVMEAVLDAVTDWRGSL
jgi:type IV secretory pathway TraG/TraD family ATPase VirD4